LLYFADLEAHCDAALNLMISVDHAGKLFERAESENPPGRIYEPGADAPDATRM